MIRPCSNADFDAIWFIVNDGAEAYRGVIPADRWTEPYMSRDALRHEIAEGVKFWGWDEDGILVGVMGLHQVHDATLIRHAYVRSGGQRQGVGGRLLQHLRGHAPGPVLIGTWADADWAIRFYRKHGFRLVSAAEKERLLRRYWTIPERQIETSVVLVDGEA